MSLPQMVIVVDRRLNTTIAVQFMNGGRVATFGFLVMPTNESSYQRTLDFTLARSYPEGVGLWLSRQQQQSSANQQQQQQQSSANQQQQGEGYFVYYFHEAVFDALERTRPTTEALFEWSRWQIRVAPKQFSIQIGSRFSMSRGQVMVVDDHRIHPVHKKIQLLFEMWARNTTAADEYQYTLLWTYFLGSNEPIKLVGYVYTNAYRQQSHALEWGQVSLPGSTLNLELCFWHIAPNYVVASVRPKP